MNIVDNVLMILHKLGHSELNVLIWHKLSYTLNTVPALIMCEIAIFMNL